MRVTDLLSGFKRRSRLVLNTEVWHFGVSKVAEPKKRDGRAVRTASLT
jgi:hypothetical protein